MSSTAAVRIARTTIVPARASEAPSVARQGSQNATQSNGSEATSAPIEPCRIPRGVVVSGSGVFATDVLIAGFILGDITAIEHGVTVDKGAVVRGVIRANSVVVNGHVEGKILTVGGSAYFGSESNYKGLLKSNSIIVEQGAQFNAQIRMLKAKT